MSQPGLFSTQCEQVSKLEKLSSDGFLVEKTSVLAPSWKKSTKKTSASDDHPSALIGRVISNSELENNQTNSSPFLARSHVSAPIEKFKACLFVCTLY